MALLPDKWLQWLPGQNAGRFVAVDFDSAYLRIVQACRTGKSVRIERLNRTPMPDNLDLDDAEAVGGFIGRTVEEMNLARCGVLMSVPRKRAALKVVALPPGAGPEETASMVRFQAEKDLPFPPEQAVIDFTITSHFDAAGPAPPAPGADETPAVSVLAGAVDADVVEHYRRVAQAAGVRLRRLGLRPYATMRCVDACIHREGDEAVAVVHVTADETEISVLKGSGAPGLAYCRSAVINVLPGGGGAEAAPETVDAVVREVTRSLHSYTSTARGGEVSTVLVVGGTGIERRLVRQLADRLGLRCELFEPGASLGLPASGDTSAFAAALGLAIAHQGEALPFDFLNPKRPAVKRNVKKIRNAAVAAGVALLLGIVMFARSTHLGRKRAELAKLTRIDDLKQINRTVKSMARRVKAVDVWLKGRVRWLDHLAHLGQLAPGCEDLYITSFSAGAGGKASFRVLGKSRNLIETFKARLAEAGYAPQSGNAGKGDKFGYTHSVEATLAVKPGTVVDLTGRQHVPRPADDDSINVLKNRRSRSSSSARPVSSPNSRSSPGPSSGRSPISGRSSISGRSPIPGRSSSSRPSPGSSSTGRPSSENRPRSYRGRGSRR